MASFTLGYWKIRGLAAPIRMMFTHTNTPFEDKKYEVTGEPGNWDRSSWYDSKPALQERHPLMNLPYVTHGERVIVQSHCCMRYIADKLQLLGATEDEQWECEQLMMEVMDIRNNAVKLFYAPQQDFDARKGSYLKFLRQEPRSQFAKLDSWLAAKKTKFLMGDKLTAPDFHLWEMIDQHEMLTERLGEPSLLANYPMLAQFHKDFKAQETLKSYFDSEASTYPVNNPYACFK